MESGSPDIPWVSSEVSVAMVCVPLDPVIDGVGITGIGPGCTDALLLLPELSSELEPVALVPSMVAIGLAPARGSLSVQPSWQQATPMSGTRMRATVLDTSILGLYSVHRYRAKASVFRARDARVGPQWDVGTRSNALRHNRMSFCQALPFAGGPCQIVSTPRALQTGVLAIGAEQ